MNGSFAPHLDLGKASAEYIKVLERRIEQMQMVMQVKDEEIEELKHRNKKLERKLLKAKNTSAQMKEVIIEIEDQFNQGVGRKVSFR